MWFFKLVFIGFYVLSLDNKGLFFNGLGFFIESGLVLFILLLFIIWGFVGYLYYIVYMEVNLLGRFIDK